MNEGSRGLDVGAAELVPFPERLHRFLPPFPRGDSGGLHDESGTSPNPSFARRGANSDRTFPETALVIGKLRSCSNHGLRWVAGGAVACGAIANRLVLGVMAKRSAAMSSRRQPGGAREDRAWPWHPWQVRPLHRLKRLAIRLAHKCRHTWQQFFHAIAQGR